jgi:ABC-type lipoprotein export system ATPase subunit
MQEVDDSEAKQVYAKQLLEACGGDPKLALEQLKIAAKAKRNAAKYTPKNSEVIVSVDGVSKSYKMGKTQVGALESVKLDIYRGEFIAITGTSGSGKSTLLQLIGGLDKPTQGDVTVGGQNLKHLSDSKLSKFRNRTIGFVFQFFYLQPFLRLQPNIEVPAMFSRTAPAARKGKSKELAEVVGLGDRLRHYPKELSGGQMQRAAIARALQNQPSILLADEPTGNLDHANATAIFELFKKIRDEQGTTVIVVTHDMALASLADRSVHMSDGAVLSGEVSVPVVVDAPAKAAVLTVTTLPEKPAEPVRVEIKTPSAPNVGPKPPTMPKPKSTPKKVRVL